MTSPSRNKLTWIVVRLGNDQNWWVEEVSDEINWGLDALSILHPEQVRFITEKLEDYRDDGYRREQFEAAFHPWRVERQLADGLLRLVPSEESFFDDGAELFALPDVPLTVAEDEKGVGGYFDFLELVERWRIHNLNRHHHYAQNVDVFDMEDELRTVDNDRYAYGAALHVFDEICEILNWSPEE